MIPWDKLNVTPTATNTPENEEEEEELSVLEVQQVLLSSFAHEETINAILIIKTNQDNKLFILFLYRKCCKIKTSHTYNINRFVLQECGVVTWSVYECEKLAVVGIEPNMKRMSNRNEYSFYHYNSSYIIIIEVF